MISTIAARRLIGSDLVVEYPLVSVEHGRISQIESLSAADHERVQATYRFSEGHSGTDVCRHTHSRLRWTRMSWKPTRRH